MKNIKLTIVCPAYNAEKSIANLIKSVLSQSYHDWELIIVNDGSRDTTQNIIESFLSDNRIVLLNQINSGPSVARNSGIDLATGSWITFVDADDTITPTYLQSLVDGIDDNANIDLICAGYFECNDRFPNGIPLHDLKSEFPETVISQQEFIKKLFHGVTGVLWGKLFRYSIIKDNNLKLHPKLKLSEDLLFVLQYIKCIKCIAIIYENIYYYNRIGEQGLSGKMDLSYLDNITLFNELVSKELGDITDYDVSIVLKKRTNLAFLKIIRDQNGSLYQFKNAIDNISSRYGDLELGYMNGENKLIALLIEKKMFRSAFMINNILQLLRKYKNA